MRKAAGSAAVARWPSPTCGPAACALADPLLPCLPPLAAVQVKLLGAGVDGTVVPVRVKNTATVADIIMSTVANLRASECLGAHPSARWGRAWAFDAQYSKANRAPRSRFNLNSTCSLRSVGPPGHALQPAGQRPVFGVGQGPRTQLKDPLCGPGVRAKCRMNDGRSTSSPCCHQSHNRGRPRHTFPALTHQHEHTNTTQHKPTIIPKHQTQVPGVKDGACLVLKVFY